MKMVSPSYVGLGNSNFDKWFLRGIIISVSILIGFAFYMMIAHGIRDKPIKNTTMDIYSDALSFCYLHNKRVDGKRDFYVECNYVDMPQKKLDKIRDYLDNYSDSK